MDLRNARALVTGGSRGIGAATAEALLDAGAHVHLVARDAERLASLADVLGCDWTAGDLLDPAFRSGVVDDIAGRHGPIDVLVNNAGIEHTGHVSEQTPSQLEAVFRLNLEVPALLCRAVLPGMLDRGRGHIVNVSSTAMAVNTPGFASYGASKSGLSSFTSSLRRELKGSGVGCTIVEIGPVETDMLRDIRSDSAADKQFARYEKLGFSRTMPAEEVATAIVRAIGSGAAAVRLPKRIAVLPALVNVTRRMSDIVQAGVPTR